MVERWAACVPALGGMAIGPHVVRETAATHVLSTRTEIQTVRTCLRHTRIDPTLAYAESDLEDHRRAVVSSETKAPSRVRPRKRDSS